jgi:hypothetical protein
MNNNYAVINGKRIELTEEQVKTLGVEIRKNPFERVDRGENYFYINKYGDVDYYEHDEDFEDDLLSQTANYFNDEFFANQVALHQLLYRKLLKFSYDNDCEDKEWNGTNDHWLIVYYPLNDDFVISNVQCVKDYTVYFSTEKGASRAINEVIRPFMKEHPEFVW